MYNKYNDPKNLIISCKIVNFWKTKIELICNKITNSVHPVITPSIVGIVFLIPKLNAVYDVIILFGPGDRDAAILKNNNEINWDDILSDI